MILPSLSVWKRTKPARCNRALINLLQSRADGFQLNESKCKELRISFIKSENTLEPVTISNTNIEVVPSAKLLGVMISNDLKWNVHVEMIGKKAFAFTGFCAKLRSIRILQPEVFY